MAFAIVGTLAVIVYDIGNTLNIWLAFVTVVTLDDICNICVAFTIVVWCFLLSASSVCNISSGRPSKGQCFAQQSISCDANRFVRIKY